MRRPYVIALLFGFFACLAAPLDLESRACRSRFSNIEFDRWERLRSASNWASPGEFDTDDFLACVRLTTV
jgi:hypothetical protein